MRPLKGYQPVPKLSKMLSLTKRHSVDCDIFWLVGSFGRESPTALLGRRQAMLMTPHRKQWDRHLSKFAIVIRLIRDLTLFPDDLRRQSESDRRGRQAGRLWAA